MAYHIQLFVNNSKGYAVTANPKTDRDTYFVRGGEKKSPGHNVELNKPPNANDWHSFSSAFDGANYIYTGTDAYCFWDSGDSELMVASYNGGTVGRHPNSKGTFNLVIDANGSISFVRV